MAKKTPQQLALARIKSRAARKFADPADAVVHLERHVDDFLDGDQVDNSSIDYALSQLLKQRPHLAAPKPARAKTLHDAVAGRLSTADAARRTKLTQALRDFKPNPAMEVRVRQLEDLQRTSPHTYDGLPAPMKAAIVAYKNRKNAAEVFAATGELPADLVATY